MPNTENSSINQNESTRPSLCDNTLIERIVKYMRGRLETNVDFLINLACVLVSTAAGPGFYIMTEKGKMFLNLSTIYVGGSGISEKSVALRIIRKITIARARSSCVSSAPHTRIDRLHYSGKYQFVRHRSRPIDRNVAPAS